MLPAVILKHELPSVLDLQQAVASPPVSSVGDRGTAGGMGRLLFQSKPWLGASAGAVGNAAVIGAEIDQT